MSNGNDEYIRTTAVSNDLYGSHLRREDLEATTCIGDDFETFRSYTVGIEGVGGG